jgi:DNA-binding transcriptional LysR family regulator
MTMSLVHLTTLRELRRRGTMVAVAEHLGYTPGAVSQQVAALEKSIGTQLVARLGRNVVLTDAGRVLAEHAQRILSAEQDALDAVHAVQNDVAGPLLLGAFGSTAAALVPPVVTVAQRDHPHLELGTVELDVDDVVAAVQSGEVDAAFGLDYPNTPMPRSADIELLTMRVERFDLAVSPTQGIRSGSMIDLRSAADWQFILPPEHTQFGRTLRVACRQAGFEPSARHEIIDTAVSIALASRGLGATFVTDLMTSLNRSVPIVRVRLTQEITRRIVLIRLTGSDVRPTIRAVTEIVRKVVTPPVRE